MQDLAVVDPAQRAISGLEAAETAFTAARREAIARFLNIEAEDPAFIPYLAVCAKYGLDPIMGDIWLIPVKDRGEDGQPKGPDKYRPSVGVAGYLSIARRTPEYRGLVDDVVHANDSFKVRREIDLETGEAKLSVFHEYPDLKDAPEEDKVGFRGPVIGAYAVAYVDGQKPTYYFADIREHGKKGARRDGTKYWKSAWSYTSAMALKAARSHALRSALGITGIVPYDELRDDEAPQVEEEEPTDALRAALPEMDDELQEELLSAIVRANELNPWAWTAAKIQMVMGNKTQAELRGVRDGIVKENEIAAEEERAGELPEGVMDAELVPDGEEEE